MNAARGAALGLLLLSADCLAEELTYSPANGLKLDLYLPAGRVSAPRAVAILIHGGQWIGGARTDGDVVTLSRWLAGAGFVAASIDYRPTYPAALDDVRAALRFVRARARSWSADPKRVALIGIEAGAHLANLAGVWTGAEPAPAAVVSFHGPSDFRGWPAAEELRRFLAPVIETRGLEAALADASPVMHIDRAAPPFLLLHGDADTVVPPVQSIHWQNALQAAGVSCNLVLIAGGAHGFDSWRGQGRDWEAQLLAWLSSVLRIKPRP